MKLTSLQFGFGFSLLVHALVFGAIIWRGNIVHTPELSREDSLIWLTLMAAPLDGITPPENRIPKAVAIPASVPASIPVETLKPTLPPEAVVKSLELEPKPAPTTPAKPVAVVSPARPATPVTGDGSSPEPGLDATTQKAQVGVRAEPDYLKNPEPPYVNDPNLRTIEPHHDFFPKMKRIMELFATGQYSLTAIQRELAAAGIVGVQSRKPLPLSSIGNFLRNPFYYGVFLHKGEMHQGIHAPMISKTTFDEIQAALVQIGKPQHRNKRGEKGFLFLNFATCGSCGYCITAERHTKKSGRRYHYYRCTHKNKKRHCDDRDFIREEQFAEEIKRNTGLVTIPDEWKEKFLAQIELWQNDEAQSRQRHADCITAELATIKSKIDRLNTAFTEGGLELSEFKELKNPLIVQKTVLEQEKAKAERGETSRLEPLKNWVLEANQAQKWVLENNWSAMKSFLQKVGSNRTVRSQTLTVSFKKHWISLAETTVAARCAATESERSSKWWRRRELNPRP